MSLTSDNVELLLACQVDELNSVTTYTDGEVLVLFLLWVLLWLQVLTHLTVQRRTVFWLL